jgi:hypothetical protein
VKWFKVIINYQINFKLSLSQKLIIKRLWLKIINLGFILKTSFDILTVIFKIEGLSFKKLTQKVRITLAKWHLCGKIVFLPYGLRYVGLKDRGTDLCENIN